MKKMVLIVVGLVVLIGAGLLIGRKRAQKEITTEYTEHTEMGEVRREGLTTKTPAPTSTTTATGYSKPAPPPSPTGIRGVRW